MTAPFMPVSLETPRLCLYPCTLQVAQAAEIGRRAVETLLGASVDTGWFEGDARGLLGYYATWLRREPTQFGWGLWLIELRAEKTVIGSIGYKGRPNTMGLIEIGYGISPRLRRQGITTEAARAMLTWAWEQPGVHAVTAECLHENAGSRGVLANIGMKPTHTHGEYLYWRIDRPVTAGDV
jgi:RimJ/RimL family protein N-acetyltransferase